LSSKILEKNLFHFYGRLASPAYRRAGLWFGKPHDGTHSPESIEKLTVPSETEKQAGKSKGLTGYNELGYWSVVAQPYPS
jgi:hypothetical protein